VNIVEAAPEHAAALTRFFADLPAGDLTFIKEDVTDPATVRSWTEAGSGRWLSFDEGTVTGYVAVHRLVLQLHLR